jgi:hypothetical protein
MDEIKYQLQTEGKEPLIKHYSKENPALTDKIPNGYMTGE